jgi:hypothetical protein
MNIDSVDGKMVVVGCLYNPTLHNRALTHGSLASWYIAVALVESNLAICTNPGCSRMGTVHTDMLRIPVKPKAVADFQLPGMLRVRIISCSGCFHIIVRVSRTGTTPPQIWNDTPWTAEVAV